jgi:hypothetical protein
MSASNWSAIMTGPGGSIEIVSRAVFLLVAKFCHFAKIQGPSYMVKCLFENFPIFLSDF